MRLILLSGGSGKRLWPLSNDLRSKQFIKSRQKGEPESAPPTSMIQRVWEKLGRHGLQHRSVIAAGLTQQSLIQTQLGACVPLVLEPVRRDTFPAVALATLHLRAEGAAAEEIAVVMPVDAEAGDGFYEAIRELGERMEGAGCEIGLIGRLPTEASDKYGYLLPGEAIGKEPRMRQVTAFIEKPPAVEAERLIRQGAWWNCGVFAFRLGYVEALLREAGLPASYEELLDVYEQLEPISFDYRVVERAASVAVLPYEGPWRDLGTWNEWTETMPGQLVGPGLLGQDCDGTHVINELQIPIVVSGIRDAVVAASPDGILVTDKRSSTGLKGIVSELDGRAMYEETSYGWYRVIDMERTSLGHALTKRLHLRAGREIASHRHRLRDEVWTFLCGEAEIVLDGQVFRVAAGDSVHFRAGAWHAVRALEHVDAIEVQSGSAVSEDDIEYETSRGTPSPLFGGKREGGRPWTET
ncbi:cupin domain-containing protein [Paenibacillus albicereus]|uniref:Cupin domain-containing protein n=1 Tax=Paenibacillus albicereus TaxID=2726185 RepID=A0A6H2GSP0_9BACL|nr:sugar phosphate nucleotidyltransferase [Paenibacillus albicereus]QJC50412.1 cupin domain-containing protein [Paenibacillus albicereus]